MSALTPHEQALYDTAKHALPKWLFSDDTAAQELLGSFAKAFATSWTQVDQWVDQAFLRRAFGMWLDQHAIDRGTRRQSNETDAALATRLRTVPDAVTLSALKNIVAGVLSANNIAGTSTFIEGRRDGYWQTDTTPAIEDFWGEGWRWEGHPYNLHIILPSGTDAGTLASVQQAVQLSKAAGVYVTYEITSPTWVYQLVTVTPVAASVTHGGATQSFVAQVRHADTVTWKVNGVAGGNATVGTISAGGVYTPPAAAPFPEDVQVQAVSTLNSAVVGTASVKVN